MRENNKNSVYTDESSIHINKPESSDNDTKDHRFEDEKDSSSK